jgi:hypothetical protein
MDSLKNFSFLIFFYHSADMDSLKSFLLLISLLPAFINSSIVNDDKISSLIDVANWIKNPKQVLLNIPNSHPTVRFIVDSYKADPEACLKEVSKLDHFLFEGFFF